MQTLMLLACQWPTQCTIPCHNQVFGILCQQCETSPLRLCFLEWPWELENKSIHNQMNIQGGLLPVVKRTRNFSDNKRIQTELTSSTTQILAERQTPWRSTTKCRRQPIRHQPFQSFGGKIPYVITTKYHREVINGTSDTHKDTTTKSSIKIID